MAEIIIPLDVPSEEEALALVDRLGDDGTFYKVGLELYTRVGPSVVHRLKDLGKKVFLDLKLHDIPNTVAGAVRAAAALEVDLLTLHSTGASPMMEAAQEASAGRVDLLAVTILTSMSPADVESIWGRNVSSVREEVVRLAGLARDAGLSGVVASAQEAGELRRALGPDMHIVTPGIRMPGGDVHDQVRVATPENAVRDGASHLVVGRAITQAADPRAAARAVMASALAGQA